MSKKKKQPKPQQLLWAHEVPRSPHSSPCGGYPGAGGNPAKSAGSVQVPKTEDIRLRLPATPGRPPAPRRAAPYRPGEGAELPGGQEAVLEAGRQPRLGHGPPEWPRPGSPVAPAEGPRRRPGCAGSRTRHPPVDTPRRCPPSPHAASRALMTRRCAPCRRHCRARRRRTRCPQAAAGAERGRARRAP